MSPKVATPPKRRPSQQRRRDESRSQRNQKRWRARHIKGGWGRELNEEDQADWALRINTMGHRKPPWKRGDLWSGYEGSAGEADGLEVLRRH